MRQAILPKEFAVPIIQRPTDDSLVFWLTGRGSRRQGTRLADLSKKRNHGTIYGAVWKNTPLGHSALNFDGVDDYVQVPDSPSLRITDQFTIALWIYPQPVSVNPRVLRKYDDSSNHYQLYSKGVNPDSFGVRYARNGSNYENQANITFEWNKWYHVVAVLSYGIKFYINGKLVPNKGGVGAGVSTDTNLAIGQYGGGGGYFKGFIDEVRIYKRTLSAKEIMELYNSTRHFFGK